MNFKRNFICCVGISSILTVLAARIPDSEEIFDSFDEGIRISYEDAKKSISHFRSQDLIDFRPITVDAKRKQLIVGARDAVVRLGAEKMDRIQRLDWPVKPRAREMCIMKGQSHSECHNFIRTIAMDGESVLLCGTHAYAPSCTWRKAVDLSSRTKNDFSGIGAAPYGPSYNSTYLMTREGELYSGIVTDFTGHDASILRILPSNRLLQTAKSNNRWLNEPGFIGSFESGNFLYFFFTEPAVETTACGLKSLSRVARVCKNDVGGDEILRGTWTTFSKASLNCTARGTRYDKLESIYFDEEKDEVYAAFTKSEVTDIPSSAICVYSISSFRDAFGSHYLYQKRAYGHWNEHSNSNDRFDCEVEGVTSRRPGLTLRPLVDAQRYQIMSKHVIPPAGESIQFSPLEEYSHLLVDSVRVKKYGIVKVIFAFTKSGLMKKFVSLPDSVVKATSDLNQTGKSCLVEVVQLTKSGTDFRPTDVKLYSEVGAIFIGSEKSVMKIPVERCWRYETRQQCVDSEDPYCGWNSEKKKCTVAPGGSTLHHYWHQKLDGCPKTNFPADGKYGEWSEWFWCPQEESQGENCHCRSRQCDSPKPRLGGKDCDGPKIQVSNCTRHGGFTKWSDWSACSATCGVSMRTRTRDCSNPTPAFGGKPCVGPTKQQEYCKQTACPLVTPPPVHGGWSQWGIWDQCSKKCGGGFQRRVRMCNNPEPANDGNVCSGCDTEFRACNTEDCEEVRRWSDWTPWLRGNVSGSGDGIWVQRFKFACRARIDDPKLVMVSRPRSQEKFCRKDGKDCTDTAFAAIDGGWSAWREWSECSKPCGNGTQSRIRTCTDPAPAGAGLDCPGHAKEHRQCNDHSCRAQWTCWSEYSECSVSCGSGVKHRVRKCNQLFGMKACEGKRVETTHCDMGPCAEDGYGVWSGWSACSELGVKVRIRPCISKSYCNGIPDAQMKRCNMMKTNALEYTSATSSGNLSLILGIVGAFLGGIALTLALTCYAVRRQSNCCYAFGMKKPHGNPTGTHPPTPIPLKSNIYTPPPMRNNNLAVHGGSGLGSQNGTLTINPLTTLLGPEKMLELAEMDGLSEQEANLTLRRTMRASLNTRDYL